MADIEVLCARIGNGRQWAGVSKERWMEVMSSYSDRARYHAANLAAHSYDVLLIDGRIMLCQPSNYRAEGPPNSAHWLNDKPYDRDAYEPVDDAFLATLYEPGGRYAGHVRKFDVPEPEPVFKPVR